MIVVVATRSKTERAKFELSAKQKVSRWSLKNLLTMEKKEQLHREQLHRALQWRRKSNRRGPSRGDEGHHSEGPWRTETSSGPGCFPTQVCKRTTFDVNIEDDIVERERV
jgi:hypothetical protein